MRSISLTRHASLSATAATALLVAACGAAPDAQPTGTTSSAVVQELAWNYVGTGAETVQQLAVAPEADGRVTLFILYTDGTLYRATQNSPSGGWVGGRTNMGANSLRQIAVIPNADGRLEVFALGGDRAAYHIWEASPNGAWEPQWQPLGGTQLQSVTVASNADGRLQMFALGGDGAVYTQAQTPVAGASFGGWQYLGGTGLRSLQPAPNQNGALNLFAIGGDYHVYSMTQTAPNGGFGAWTRPLGDNTTVSLIAPVANLDGRIELVVHRTDGEMMHSWQTSPNGPFYGSFYDYGVDNVSEFAAAREADGRIVLFMNQSGALWSLSQVAANGTWATHLGALAGTGVKEVHVAAGNGARGAIRLFTSNAYYEIGQLDEAGPNGPWETNQVNPRAQVSLNVPSQEYVGTAIPVSWTLSPDPLCTPQVHVSATEGAHNTMLFDHVYTTSGSITIPGAMLGTVEVGAVPSCTNGAAGTTKIDQVQIVPPPPSVCGAGQPPPQSWPFCITFTSGLFAGECWDEPYAGCSEGAAESALAGVEPADAIIKQESSCPADCNQ